MSDRVVTLITNLDFATINGVRAFAHAIMVDDDPTDGSSKEFRVRVRGFSTHASLPVFDMFVPSATFVKCGGDREGDAETQCDLTFEDGPTIHLTKTVMSDRAFLIETFTNPDITHVFDLLEMRVAQFWNAPNMPVRMYLPADQVRWSLRSRIAGDPIGNG